jgi:hypothetical protein
MTMSLISRIRQQFTIACYDPNRHLMAGTITGLVGGGIGAFSAPLHVLFLAMLVGGVAGYLASAILWAICAPAKEPETIQPISEARLWSVLQLAPVDALCADCQERLWTNPVAEFLKVECEQCESIARHREMNNRAAVSLRAVLPLPCKHMDPFDVRYNHPFLKDEEQRHSWIV